ncbi:hypothetical protein [Solirubrobacter soli]|uniref:hypothetical protein n=1 Tax=Solirubrobacter soli TaxID=363832 RepID=UPI00041DEF2C|nr:hypothetical protein [Solirubrobacter soli]
MSRTVMASLLVVVMLLATAASARAADTLTVTFGADPTEEVPIPITATWTSSDPDPRVIVTIKPDGPLGCGSAYNVDDPNSSDVIYTSGSASGSTTQTHTIYDPGTSIVCGYLQNSSSDASPLAVTGAVRLTVRSARATVSIQVPPRVDAGQAFALNAPVNTELSRRLIITLKPAGGRGCEATYALDDPNSTDVLYTTVQGTQTGTDTITAPTTNGTYLLCAYVVESGSDPAPEATSSATFLVGPDPCVTARAKLTAANKAVTTAEKAVARYRKSYKAYERKARRAHGAKRASYKRLAKRDKSRYKSAVRTRSKKRAALSTAQAGVTAACGA